MTLEEYQYELSPTDDHLRALGLIMVESGVLEGVVEIAIWQTLNLPYWIGQRLTVNPNLGQLINMLLSVIPQSFTEDNDKVAFAPIAQELKAVASLRNYIVHCYWTFGVAQDRPVSLNFRNEKGAIVPRNRTWKVTELEQIAARISRVGDELEWYLQSRGVSVPPTPTRVWRRYQVPPQPKWASLTGRTLRRRQRSFPTKPPKS